jgi:hypothetical protein
MDFASTDLDALLEEGVTVTVAGDSPAKGVFRVAQVEVELNPEQKSVELHPTVLVRNDALTLAVKHADIVVGGTTYKVREVQRFSNGQWKLIVLAEVKA